ncbi:MAG: restriction endonuclease subunit S [Sphingobium sp.]|uniref:restriction endonuclease subunit S n=1 Tax=Sphingobium sp. TaxID=1912891 RepID=UPI003BB19EDF
MSNEVPAGWSKVTLGEVTTVKARIGWRGLAASEYTKDGPFLIAGKHIRSGIIDWAKCDHLSTFRYDESPEIQLRAGDIILSKDGSIGNPALIDELPGPATINGTMMMVRPKQSHLDPSYLYQVVRGADFNRMIREKVSGSSIPHIFQRDIVHFPVVLPSPDEQRRIAEVLRTVDEAIASEQQCRDQAKTVRASLLQEHFHMGEWAEGLPLPDGWQLPLLDSVAVRGSGHTPNKKRPEYWDGGIRWVSLQDTKRLDQVYIAETAQQISALGIDNSSAVLHPDGVVVISRDATVGRSAITVGQMAVSQHFIAYRCGPKVDNRYLYYWLQRMKPVFERIGAGSTIKTIGLPFFKGLRISLPPIDVQKEVAGVMLDVDLGILASEKAIASLSDMKAALMSDLLSGRVRVPA